MSTSEQNRIIDEIAERIASGLRLLGGLKEGAEAQVRAIVEGALKEFDVVTGERMQVQEAMLANAREELEKLEARVAELEKRLKRQPQEKPSKPDSSDS